MQKTTQTIDTGSYIGYTEGAPSKPTLYFDKGHYTQFHDNPKNVGWHPNISPNHTAHNISADAAAKYEAIRNSNTAARDLPPFVKNFRDGLYNADGDGTKYFEVTVAPDKYATHVSRGHLKNDGKYNTQYATGALKSAQLA